MINSELFDREREQFFLQTQGGVYFPILGALFWLSLSVAGYFLTPRVWCISVLGFFALMIPISIIFFRMLVNKLLLKSPFASLIFIALMPVFLSFVIMVPVYFSDPSLVPFTIVISLTFHWPIIGWLYNQPVFLIHSLVRTLIAVLMWLFLPQYSFTLLPFLIGILYLITAWWVLRSLHQIKTTSLTSN